MKPGSPETIVDVRIIIMFKYLCDFDTIGARQAIFAIRAGDRNYPVVFLPDFIDEIQLFLGKHGGTGSAGAIEIFKNMLHGGHAAEQYRNLGVIPHPLQGPIRGGAAHRSALPQFGDGWWYFLG